MTFNELYQLVAEDVERSPFERHAELEEKYNSGTITPEEIEEAQRIVDSVANERGFTVGVAEHRTDSDGLDENKFDLSRAGSRGGGRTDFYKPAIWFAIPSQKTRDLIATLAQKGFPPPYGGKVIRAYLKIVDGKDFDQTEKNGTRILGVTDPSRIKSADPFTGVPLERRFNQESHSILEKCY